MSRKQAKDKYNWKAVQKDLEKKGVKVLSAGADEVPGVYKDIEDGEQCRCVVSISEKPDSVFQMGK